MNLWKYSARFLSVVLFLFVCMASPLYALAGNVTYDGTAQQFIFAPGSNFSPTDLFTDFKDVMPGDVVSKKVTVENNCAHPFYLRVKVVYGINSQVLPVEDCFKLDMNDTDWVFHDGWYYYKNIVAPGETTPAVFSHVEIVGSKVDNSYIGKTLSLTVKAHAVQSENNTVPLDAIFTASGWPKE